MMKIFGIGLSKTGTTSLTEALNMLGYKAIHFPDTVFLIDSFEASTDTSIAIGYKFLDIMYQGSKFILTTRQMDEWLDSCAAFGVFQMDSPPIFNRHLHHGIYHTSVGFDREAFQKAHTRHLLDVNHYFQDRPSDILILNVCGGDGWEPLCNFLGKPVPDAPFPHLHKGVAILNGQS